MQSLSPDDEIKSIGCTQCGWTAICEDFDEGQAMAAVHEEEEHEGVEIEWKHTDEIPEPS
jgi:hypothetical protein